MHERQLLSSLARDVGSAVASFDADAEREQVRKRQAALRRAPGEQTMLPIYTEHAEPTPLEALPPHARRRQLEAL